MSREANKGRILYSRLAIIKERKPSTLEHRRAVELAGASAGRRLALRWLFGSPDVDGKGSMMAVVLIPLPYRDFDPTEAGVPWRLLYKQGHRVIVATEDGRSAEADPRMLTGEGLGIFAPFMKADANGRLAYEEMTRSEEFRHPIPYPAIRTTAIDALILPGGHAPGMRPYLESVQLQALAAELIDSGKPVGAICHGVLIAARGRRADGKSALHGRKATALPKIMELTGWLLTRPFLGNYLRTYATTVEDEVRASLANRNDFVTGPMSVRRDSPRNLKAGFTVRDRNLLSARWFGDAHRFAHDFAAMLDQGG